MNQETENKIVARMKNRIAGISLWKNWVSPDIIDWEDHNGYEVFEPQEIKSYEEVLNQLDNLNRMGKLASGGGGDILENITDFCELTLLYQN